MTKTKPKKLPIKFQEPDMSWNVALEKFEPVLPLRKTGKKVKIEINWKLKVAAMLILLYFVYPYLGIIIYAIAKIFNQLFYP